MSDLTSDSIYSTITTLFPSQNDSGQRNFQGVLQELNVFGIVTLRDFESLMVKHRTTLLDIDSGRKKHRPTYFPTPLFSLLENEEEIKRYKEIRGNDLRKDFDNCLKNRYWHSYVVLIRLAIELEFGAKYMNYLEDKWESQSGDMFEGDWVQVPNAPDRKLNQKT